MQPGDPVLLRSVFGGLVRWAFPHHFVGEDGGRLIFYRRPGNAGKQLGRNAEGRYLDRWVRGDPVRDHVWQDTQVLSFVRPGEWHALQVWWDEAWSFGFWYVNLQAPVTPTRLGYDSTDWALDIIVSRDGTAHWKDEDDFAEVRVLGALDDQTADTVRREGERVIAERPWPTGWEEWRPPPEWEPLPLPAGWDVVD